MRQSSRFAAVALTALLAFAAPAFADDERAPDDIVFFDLSNEAFVTTQTANVQIAISAAASDEKAGTLRADMQKAVTDLAKGEWRLTSFTRSADQSGLTRWDALYEARLPEGSLAGLSDRAQKASKPGMKLTVNNIDFTPTLAETETKRGELRTELYKRADEEVKRLNSTLPGRNYRIAGIQFGTNSAMPMARPMMMKAARAPMMEDASAFIAEGSGGADIAQRLAVTARVTLAARPPVEAAAK